MQKSANKLWKESGTTLPFKEWIEREKQKFNYQDDNRSFDGLSLDTYSLNTGVSSTSSSTTKTFFGLSNTTLIIAGLIIVGASGFYIYKKVKK
jgi:LPXTG-motif cell wall-anchored protein